MVVQPELQNFTATAGDADMWARALFMGSGSTVAAARAVGLHAVGIEFATEYHAMAQQAVPLLAQWKDG